MVKFVAFQPPKIDNPMHLLFRKPRRATQSNSREIIEYEQIPVPVHLFVESRKNSRISLLKDKVHIRLPRSIPKALRQTEIRKLLLWAEKCIANKGMYNLKQSLRDYTIPFELTLASDTWLVSFRQNDGNKIKVSIHPEEQQIRIAGDHFFATTKEGKRTIKKLFTRVICQHYRKDIKSDRHW